MSTGTFNVTITNNSATMALLTLQHCGGSWVAPSGDWETVVTTSNLGANGETVSGEANRKDGPDWWAMAWILSGDASKTIYVMVKDGFIPFKCSNVESQYGQLNIGLTQNQVTLDDGDGNPSTAAVLSVSAVDRNANMATALLLGIISHIFGETIEGDSRR